MKKLLIIAIPAVILFSCGSDPKTTPAETRAVETQIAKDQAAMDSMEKVIQQQIEAASKDSVTDETK